MKVRDVFNTSLASLLFIAKLSLTPCTVPSNDTIS
ncbi:hypothetical protein GLYMA_16G058850v4 [Glycine max]|nr:hypothetical protein GLYMA_16G058850v4 [Glycine max]KAH1150164.1 hypothetical protein GYH30_044281 [Glycine max]